MKLLLLTLLSTMLLFGGEQLKIVADHLSASEKEGRSVFEGNVRIKKGADELNASRVEVYVDDERRPTEYVAQGNASFFIRTEDNATYRGRAQKVIYRPQSMEYRFLGDVHLVQLNEHKQIDGDEVVVNIQEGTARAKGADKQPVIMIFDIPDEVRQ